MSKYSHLNTFIKALLALALMWIIHRQIAGKSELLGQWLDHLNSLSIDHYVFLILAILLLPFNIFLESQKWWVLVNTFEKHSRSKAYLSILVAVPAAIITPARLGEYFGRLMYISPENNWKAVWSNMACGISQGIANISLGLVGLTLFYLFQFELSQTVMLSSFIGAIIFLIFLLLIYYNLNYLPILTKKIGLGKYMKKILNSMQMVYDLNTRVLNKVLALATFRFLIFLTQYYLLLRFWGVEAESIYILAGISIVFMIQSVSPLPPFIDFFARGELALLILGVVIDNPLSILSAAFTLWIINLGIPALIGLLFMFNINITKTMGYD